MAVLLALVILPGRISGEACSPSAVTAAEEQLQALERELGEITAELSRLDGEMQEIGREVNAVEREAEGSARKRRQLERLLRDSRARAEEMERLGARKATLERQRVDVTTRLRVCYVDSLEATLRALVQSVKDRRYDQARERMGVAESIESRLAALGPGQTSTDYPIISEPFFESSLASVEDRAFLIDTIDDLQEKARADSSKAQRRLTKLTESLRLKSDLMRLVREAREGGLDRGAFFEEFGRDDLERQIADLDRDVAATRAAMSRAAQAVAYYEGLKRRLRADVTNNLK